MHVIIKNALVYTMDAQGTVNADVLVKDGKIAAIGSGIVSDGAEIIDASGKIVTPGFVDAHSHIAGMSAYPDQDINEMTNPLTPELDIYYGINMADSVNFDSLIRHGITVSCVAPGSANVVCGWCMTIKSAGSDRVMKRPVAMKAAMGINPKGIYTGKNMAPNTRMAIADMLRGYLTRVKDYMEKKEAAGDDKSKLPPYDLGLEHGIPVLKKEIPLKVHSYMHDMMTVIEIAREFDILVTLDHALGASDFYDELQDEHVFGVVYGPFAEPLFGGEGGKLDPEACSELYDRGVTIAMMTDTFADPGDFMLNQVAEVVRRGHMDPANALALITSNAAKISMVWDRVGSVTVGKDADLLIWDKLPTLYTDAVLEQVFIDGESVYKSEA